ncbi:MAG TPA: FKBP-type peptidyl-prolyl cis-trans isomerase [Bacteroidales bacterium]|nr:FKBP-type peptidyl-prolyl cis-trans isomerase [Bacteroidales bacterium]HPT10908.1 FKBP-type peptidyl-prolyl cis-trans isomerase [Bacteroidales bacterium]
MKKVFVNSLVFVMLFALTFLACSSKYAGYDKTATGLYYKLFKVSKDTIKPKIGDWVSLTMKYTYKDSTLFDSKQAMGSPVRFQLPVSDFKGDIYEGIAMLSPGDSADFIINADSLFKKTFRQPTRPAFIDTNSVIHFYITLLTVDSPETLMKKEVESLKKYVEEKKITVAPLASGLYFVETTAGKGNKIDSGVWVKAHFKVSLIDGKQIFSSYDRGEPMQFEYGKRFDTPGFEEGISKMTKGGKATLVVPSKIAFGEMGRGAMVPPYSTIIYEVEVVDVMSKAQHDKQIAEEKKQAQIKMENAKKQEGDLMKKYLADKKITAKPTASGLIYQEKVKGTGAKAAAGKKVKVHYTGTLLNGTKFDSSRDRNEPFEFTLGQGQVIKGWDEGIALMNVGGKATLIIPSAIGYGDRDMGTIPPYSTLVFDVELLDVK